jgi:hypothetical protein
MQQELNNLRQQVRTLSQSQPTVPLPAQGSSMSWQRSGSLSASSGIGSALSRIDALDAVTMESSTVQLRSDTTAQRLNDQEFGPNKIDDCFAL